MSNKKKGDKAEEIVKRSLWQRNFRVKDVSRVKQVSGQWFDLLVNDKYRVEVKSIHNGKERGTVSFRHTNFDVLCVVLCGELRNSIYYLKDICTLPEILRPNKSININPKLLNKYFTTKPEEVMQNIV